MRLLADENLDNRIVNGLRRRLPDIDIVRVQDVGLGGRTDAEVPGWCGTENRILLTHDLSTIRPVVADRMTAGLAMPGVFEISLDTPIAQAIEELLLIVQCSLEGEWDGQIRFIPL